MVMMAGALEFQCCQVYVPVSETAQLNSRDSVTQGCVDYHCSTVEEKEGGSATLRSDHQPSYVLEAGPRRQRYHQRVNKL